MTAKKKLVVAIEWIHHDVQDADEVVVFAADASEARRKARARWQKEIAPKWPGIRIVRTFVLTDRVHRMA